jgi:septal ring factor EnvC (AmiA/AmiB activator)
VRYLTLFLLIFFGWGASSFVVYAQTTSAVDARRAELQRQLDEEEKEIKANLELLNKKQKDTATVKGEVDKLKAQIAEAQNIELVLVVSQILPGLFAGEKAF